MKRLKLLALSGSLRQHSLNTMALAALVTLAPEGVDIVCGDIASLPLFNPDLEGHWLPAVKKLTAALQQSDGLIIASPEYAHGISGPMKNALDWLVGSIDFPAMPIMLINTSPRASHAQDALKEILTTMSAELIQTSFVSLPLLGANIDVEGIVATPQLATALQRGVGDFCQHLENKAAIENNALRF